MTRAYHLAPRLIISAAILVASCADSHAAERLTVNKIEPPNWWLEMQHNELQLLMYGENLHDTTVESTSGQVTVQRTQPSASGRYCFVDISIPQNATEGIAKLKVRGPRGFQEVSFPIWERTDAHSGGQGFGPEDVIYLITPDRFANGDLTNDRAFVDEFDRSVPSKRHGGDLQGIIDRLDYIADLGVTTIWLNPVLENRGINSYHGYKTTDYYRIDPRFGSNKDYKRLVREAHRRSLKVIFDHVSNHVGLQHPWVSDPPQSDWFNGTIDKHLSHKHFLFSPSDPYALDTTRNELKQFWFVDRMPDLNQKNDRLREYLIQNAIWWVEYAKLDGFREDTYPYADQQHMRSFVEALEREFPRLKVVGEIWALEAAYIAQYQKGSPLARSVEGHLPSVMDFPLMDVYRRYIQGTAELKDIYQTLATDFVYADPNMLVTFVENHDTQRAVFIADRKVDRLRIALHLLLTTRGIPQLLYGSEIDMFGGPRHVDLRADFPGGFPDDARNAFSIDGRSDDENDAFQFLRQLLHLRRKHRALTLGRLMHVPPVDDIYMHVKKTDDQTVVCIANGRDESRRIDLGRVKSQVPPNAELVDLRDGTRFRAGDGLELGPMKTMILEVLSAENN